MPYIHENAREGLDPVQALQIGKIAGCTRGIMLAGTAGELNYQITRLVDDYLVRHGGSSYQVLNEIMGVLECAKQEFYRRRVAPYEDIKIRAHGDVYVEGIKS